MKRVPLSKLANKGSVRAGGAVLTITSLLPFVALGQSPPAGEAAPYVVIRTPSAIERLQWQPSPFNPFKTSVRTGFSSVQPYPSGELKDKIVGDGRLAPGIYVAKLYCSAPQAGSASPSIRIEALQPGYEYIVDCMTVTRRIVVAVAKAQPILEEDPSESISKARQKLIGKWKLTVNLGGESEDVEIAIREVEGKLVGKIKGAKVGGDIRVNAQRRAMWIESKWMVGKDYLRTQFVGDYVGDELRGIAYLENELEATWSAVKIPESP